MIHALLVTPAYRTRHRIRALQDCVAPQRQWGLAAQVALLRLVMPCLKRWIPLTRLVPAVARVAGRTPKLACERRLAVKLAWLMFKPLSRSAGGRCLERSLTLYFLLLRKRLPAQLVVGAKLGETATSWHAWVCVQDEPVSEPEETLAGFVPVVAFDADGNRIDALDRFLPGAEKA